MILASSTCNAFDTINKRSPSSPELQIIIFVWQDQEHSNNIPITESNAYVSDPVLQLFLTWATYYDIVLSSKNPAVKVVASGNTS